MVDERATEQSTGWKAFDELRGRKRTTVDDPGKRPQIPEPPPKLARNIDPHSLNTKELAKEITEWADWHIHLIQWIGEYEFQEQLFKAEIERLKSDKQLEVRGLDSVTGKMKPQDQIKAETAVDPEIVSYERDLAEVQGKLRKTRADADAYDKKWRLFVQERKARQESWHYDPENLRGMDMEREAEEKVKREERVRRGRQEREEW